MKILLAEDSRTLRQAQRQQLDAIGLNDVVEAEDGRRALECFRHHRFDLVLTDLHMPGLNGLELVEAIRAIDREVPIIMVTHESERSLVVSAIRSGINDYLVKPYSADALREKVALWVDEPQCETPEADFW